MGLFSNFFGKGKKDTSSEKTVKKQEESNSSKNEEEKKAEIKEKQQPNATKEIYDTESADMLANDSGTKKLKENNFGGAFEIKKSKDGRYVFNLYAANHVIVATSQIYSSSQSAVTGINSVIANAEKAEIEDQTLKSFAPKSYPKWEIYIDKAGQFRFRLLASNGSCVCHSQGYTQKSTCKKGIESIIRTVKSAEIDKAYLKKD
jgi:uncharacterized protein YegP (UPF0339 family)